MKNKKLIQSTISLNTNEVQFSVRKNKRLKSKRLVVSPDEGLVVETPRHVKLKIAKRMIRNRRQWVIPALKEANALRLRTRDLKKFRRSLLVFGQEKRIIVKTNTSKANIRLLRNHIFVSVIEKNPTPLVIQSLLTVWLKNFAKKYLSDRTKTLAKRRFIFNKIFIKEQKSIWGSCSSEANINLNWRLMMAPKKSIDYIILHELCHTRYLDHSPEYWQQIKRFCPKFKSHEKWFDTYGFILNQVISA